MIDKRKEAGLGGKFYCRQRTMDIDTEIIGSNIIVECRDYHAGYNLPCFRGEHSECVVEKLSLENAEEKEREMRRESFNR